MIPTEAGSMALRRKSLQCRVGTLACTLGSVNPEASQQVMQTYP